MDSGQLWYGGMNGLGQRIEGAQKQVGTHWRAKLGPKVDERARSEKSHVHSGGGWGLGHRVRKLV